MKKFTRFIAFAASAAMLLLASCSNYITDAIVEDNTDSDSSMRTVKFSITSENDLIDFSDGNGRAASRDILPDAYEISDLDFYYQYKNITKGDSTYTTATKVEVTADAASTKTGTVVLNISSAQYEFVLYAVKTGTANPTFPGSAVLRGTASADLRSSDAVNFFLTADGLTTDGNVKLKLSTTGWTVPPEYTVTADLTYTKTTGAGAINTRVANTNKSLTLPTTAPSTENYSVAAKPGTYNFTVYFTSSTKTYEWSDRVTVLPGKDTTDTIAIPDVIAKAPNAPAKLLANFVDTTTDSTLYYTGQFVWDDSSVNEKYFELQVMEVPAAITSAYDQPTSDGVWDTLRSTSASNNGSNFIYGTATTTLAGIPAVTGATYKIFYGQADAGYIGGSLSKNSEVARMYLTLGTRYVARIRAVNDAGASPWTYATLGSAADITADATKNIDKATGYTSTTLNRYRVTYSTSGGNFIDVTDGSRLSPQPDTVYYYSQSATGNKIMDAKGDTDFKPTESDKPATVITKAYLKWGSKNWTNWLSEYKADGSANTADANGVKAYNAVKAAPAAYTGCVNLVLTANYATIGAITIFDDNDYAIGTITSTPDFTIANQNALGLTIAQDDSATEIKWVVTYPTGVTYDSVTLEIKKTDAAETAIYTPLAVYSTGSCTFTIPYKEYQDGIYIAKIFANTKVRPNDPYQKTIILNITQTNLSREVAATDSITITQVGNVLTAVTPTYSESVTYQWKKDGTNVAGATGQTLTLTSASDNGSYTVEVTGATSGNTATSTAYTATFFTSAAKGLTYTHTNVNGTITGATSSDIGVVTVSVGADGTVTVTSKAPGTAKITFTDGTNTDTDAVTITVAADGSMTAVGGTLN